jgi:hypothetical protein
MGYLTYHNPIVLQRLLQGQLYFICGVIINVLFSLFACTFLRGWISVVSVAYYCCDCDCLRAEAVDESDLNPACGKIFSFFTVSRPVLGSILPPGDWVGGGGWRNAAGA